MADEFRLAVDAQDVDFKAYARHFEHPGEADEPSSLESMAGKVTVCVASPRASSAASPSESPRRS